LSPDIRASDHSMLISYGSFQRSGMERANRPQYPVAKGILTRRHIRIDGDFKRSHGVIPSRSEHLGRDLNGRGHKMTSDQGV